MDFIGFSFAPVDVIAFVAAGLVGGFFVGAVVGALSAVYRRS